MRPGQGGPPGRRAEELRDRAAQISLAPHFLETSCTECGIEGIISGLAADRTGMAVESHGAAAGGHRKEQQDSQ